MAIFEGSSYKVISETGTSMFTSLDGINIEVKKKKINQAPEIADYVTSVCGILILKH